MEFASPVALVTGSTSGIGAAIARRLSSEGFSVVFHSRSSVEQRQALAREVGSATYVQADLADDADRVRLIREAVAAWGRLDVLVNNAGISRVIPHADLAEATAAVGPNCVTPPDAAGNAANAQNRKLPADPFVHLVAGG
jgi:NAD(P)-dependent dehydrogenase (short-subunit alcohol dehydrogenase family)